MEGLGIAGSRAAYNVVVVGQYFDDDVRTSPDAIFESEFH